MVRAVMKGALQEDADGDCCKLGTCGDRGLGALARAVSV